MFKSSPESHRYVAYTMKRGRSTNVQLGESLQMFAFFIENHITHVYLELSLLCNNVIFITTSCITFKER